MGSGLFLLSFVTGLWTALAAATLFAWGVAFFFPTMVGLVSERLPKTGSLGIVLTAGVGLGHGGRHRRAADGQDRGPLPGGGAAGQETLAVLQQVDERFPAHIARAQRTVPPPLGYRELDVQEALDATRTALTEYERTGTVQNDATANALRAISAAPPGRAARRRGGAIVQPAELIGGQKSFRYIAPAALVLIAGVRRHVRERSPARRLPRRTAGAQQGDGVGELMR
jgi:hypothetical protein